jgi:antitoxin MazE
MIRRLYKSGNSIVLSLPKEVLEGLGIRDGESVYLELDHERRRAIISPVEKSLAITGMDETFALQVDAFIQEYRSALAELAR